MSWSSTVRTTVTFICTIQTTFSGIGKKPHTNRKESRSTLCSNEDGYRIFLVNEWLWKIQRKIALQNELKSTSRVFRKHIAQVYHQNCIQQNFPSDYVKKLPPGFGWVVTDAQGITSLLVGKPKIVHAYFNESLTSKWKETYKKNSQTEETIC